MTDCAAHLDLAAVLLDDLLDDHRACSARIDRARICGPEESIENKGLIFGQDSIP